MKTLAEMRTIKLHKKSVENCFHFYLPSIHIVTQQQLDDMMFDHELSVRCCQTIFRIQASAEPTVTTELPSKLNCHPIRL